MLTEMEDRSKCVIVVSKNEHVLEMKITGQLTEYTANQLLQDVPLLAEEHPCRNYLFDIRSLQGTLGIGNLYFYVKNLTIDRSKNIAIVAEKENERYYYFMQTVAYNRHINLRYFDRIEEAREWLKEKGQAARISENKIYVA